jgi:Zn-dependent metalloprotease
MSIRRNAAHACARGVVLCLAALVTAAAGAAPPTADLRVRYSRHTGLATFVTAARGGAIGADRPGAPADPNAFLAAYGSRFGVIDPAAQLELAGQEADVLGHHHTTYRQVHHGVPVFSGILKVHQDQTGAVIAANGKFYPLSPKLDLHPALEPAAAGRIAAAALAVPRAEIAACELVIVDPGWYGDPPLGPHLAYSVVAIDRAGVREEGFFIDAHTGEVLDRWSMLCTALDRSIHDAAGTAALPGPLARSEGQGPVTDADVNAAYDYAGDTYHYFWYAFGRDSFDAAGRTIVATANSTAAVCPNAFWTFTGRQAAFCAGTVSDDVVAHEITHGVTQQTANLIYQNQSGQLNESFSDVFGELVDLFNGGAAWSGAPEPPPAWSGHPTGPGTDAPNSRRTACSDAPAYPNGVRWLFGEDATAWTGGALRDMWDPTCRNDPDRANSPLQTCNLGDSGGVHHGSGIPNHAFAMLADGQTFNGYTINAIGPIKAGAVWYRALTTYLTISSDFEDAYAAFNQAAADLVGTTPLDPRTGIPSSDLFTAADALEVDNALRAVEMDTPGACGATVTILNPDPPLLCAARATLFADDFESGVNGWAVFNSNPPTPYDWVQTTAPLPMHRPGVAWTAADPNLGDCNTSGTPEMGTHSLVSPVIALPAGLYLPALVFTHYVETEPRYDGGHVLIRVNGGSWQTLPAAAFRYNAYNTTLFSAAQGSTNPNAGQLAFSGADGQWGTSLVDLSPYVSGGDTLQVRFDFSKDWCFGFTGWFVDDFEIYHCPTATDCNGNAVADDVDVAAGPHRDALVVQPPNHSSGNPSDLDNSGMGVTALADNVIFLRPQALEVLRLWGGYYRYSLAPPDRFTVRVHADNGGLPGPVLAARGEVPSTRIQTGQTFLSTHLDEYVYTLTLAPPILLDPGTYFIEVLNNTTGSTDTFIWQRATVGPIVGAAYAYEAPGVTWSYDGLINMSLELYGPVVGTDCNTNATPDECETLPDCNTNGTPDPCDAWGDHNGRGGLDPGDLATFVSCLAGPGMPAAAGCTCRLDADADGDLDLRDFAALQSAF